MIFFEWLESSFLAVWVGESLWGYPIMLSAHAVGLSIVVGMAVVVDLRLLNAFSAIRIDSLGGLFKLGGFGFLINACSGFALFSSQATEFIESTAFLLKISMIIVAVFISALLYAHLEKSRLRGEDNTVPSRTKILAWTSIAVWAGAVITGRLVAYF